MDIYIVFKIFDVFLMIFDQDNIVVDLDKSYATCYFDIEDNVDLDNIFSSDIIDLDIFFSDIIFSFIFFYFDLNRILYLILDLNWFHDEDRLVFTNILVYSVLIFFVIELDVKFFLDFNLVLFFIFIAKLDFNFFLDFIFKDSFLDIIFFSNIFFSNLVFIVDHFYSFIYNYSDFIVSYLVNNFFRVNSVEIDFSDFIFKDYYSDYVNFSDSNIHSVLLY